MRLRCRQKPGPKTARCQASERGSIGGEVVTPYNKQLQRTVMHKVPRHMRQRAAAELRR